MKSGPANRKALKFLSSKTYECGMGLGRGEGGGWEVEETGKTCEFTIPIGGFNSGIFALCRVFRKW